MLLSERAVLIFAAVVFLLLTFGVLVVARWAMETRFPPVVCGVLFLIALLCVIEACRLITLVPL
jgi:hypothetical protein